MLPEDKQKIVLTYLFQSQGKKLVPMPPCVVCGTVDRRRTIEGRVKEKDGQVNAFLYPICGPCALEPWEKIVQVLERPGNLCTLSLKGDLDLSKMIAGIHWEKVNL